MKNATWNKIKAKLRSKFGKTGEKTLYVFGFGAGQEKLKHKSQGLKKNLELTMSFSIVKIYSDRV